MLPTTKSWDVSTQEAAPPRIGPRSGWLQNSRLHGDRQIMLAIDNRFALSKPSRAPGLCRSAGLRSEIPGQQRVAADFGRRAAEDEMTAVEHIGAVRDAESQFDVLFDQDDAVPT